MNALTAANYAAIQMIDTPIVRVHQHAACIARNKRQSMGRSRGATRYHKLAANELAFIQLASTQP